MSEVKTLLYCIINEMGIPPRLIGVDYLETAILYVYEHGRTNLCKSVYPAMCEKFNVSQSLACKNMVYALKHANKEVVRNMFRESLFGKDGEIRVSDFIFGVAKYIEVYKKTHQ